MFEKFIPWFKNHFRAHNPHEIVVENVPVKPEQPKVTPFVRKALAAGIQLPLPTKDQTKLYPMPPPQVRSTARPPVQRPTTVVRQEEDNTSDALLSALILSDMLRSSRVEDAPRVESFQGGGGGSGGAGASGSWDDSPAPERESSPSSSDSSSSFDSSSDSSSPSE